MMLLPVLLLFVFVSEAAAQLIISEFRVRGPNGANDEFIEIYNASGANHTVSPISGSGYGIAASNGVTRCSIPTGTVIPNRGHYLCVNSVGYSLASYPAGNGTTATGDATYTTDIPDNAGIAIFNNNSGGASYALANRMDAVGSTSEANTLYKEGTGYLALSPFSIDYSFSRDECGKIGSITNFTSCILAAPKDTNNNAADFIFNDTNGTSAGAGQRLGAPGPQNLSSPVAPPYNSQTYKIGKVDTCFTRTDFANRARDLTSDPPNNSTFGTLDLRFRLTNLTGANTTRLRLRIIDLATFPAPSGFADLRPRTSTAILASTDNPPCGTGTSNITVQGTTLEQPPSQPNGGGFNSSLSANTVTVATPIPNGGSIDLRVLFGIQRVGRFKLGFVIETLPGGGAFYYINGDTNDRVIGRDTLGDYNADDKTDISIFRPSVGQWWRKSSYAGTIAAHTFGVSTDKIVPGDYTGNAFADSAVFRPSNGTWYVLRDEDFTFYSVPFGVSTDIPAPADFDGDGHTDMAVFRPSTGTWYILRSSDLGITIQGWGSTGDLPVAADYDGDDRADLAIWRPSLGQWWISYSSGGTFAATFGIGTDKAVPGDYTGDNRADIAIWRPSNGNWYVLRSEDFSYYSVPFGISTDLPVPGDYDGDWRIDPAVYRPSSTEWFLLKSNDGTTIETFGFLGDIPTPGAYVR